MISDDTVCPFFACTVCRTVDELAGLCAPSSRGGQLLCVRCCGCATHQPADPGGTVVLDFRVRHPWRGLDGRQGKEPAPTRQLGAG